MQAALVQPGLVVLCYQVLTFAVNSVIITLKSDILSRYVSLLTVYHRRSIDAYYRLWVL